MEHVPVFRPAHGSAVFVLLVEQLNIEPLKERFHLCTCVECRARRARPAVEWPEEVPGEDPARSESTRNTSPDKPEFARVAEREAQPRVDEVCLRQLQLVEGSDDRRQPRTVFGRDGRTNARDRLSRSVNGGDRPAARQERKRLAAVSHPRSIATNA